MKQYTIKKLKKNGEYWFHNPPLTPMTHEQALTMCSKSIDPASWAIHELIPVVVKFFTIPNNFGICHAESHQNAFRAQFNTEQEAIDHALNHGCLVSAVITYDGDNRITKELLPAFLRDQAI